MVFCYQNFSAHLWEKFVLFIDQEKVLKFDADGRELTKCLRSLEQSIQIIVSQNNFWNRMLF